MLYFVVVASALIVLNPFWSNFLPIVGTGQKIALLQKVNFSHADFPRWQMVLAISLIGMLVGLDPNAHAATPRLSAAPLWASVLTGWVVTWIGFFVIVGVLHWWMKRGGRWDGRGDLLNLVAASWLVANTLGAGLSALGAPALFTLPLWLYSVWVGAHALSCAIPKASIGYSIFGIAISLIPTVLVTGALFAALDFMLVAVGIVPSSLSASVLWAPGMGLL